MTEASTWRCGRGVPAKGGGWRACGGGYRWQMIGGSGMRIAAVAVAVAVRWFEGLRRGELVVDVVVGKEREREKPCCWEISERMEKVLNFDMGF